MKRTKYSKPYQSEKVVIEFTGNMDFISKWFEKNLLANVDNKYHFIKKEKYNVDRRGMIMHIEIK